MTVSRRKRKNRKKSSNDSRSIQKEKEINSRDARPAAEVIKYQFIDELNALILFINCLAAWLFILEKAQVKPLFLYGYLLLAGFIALITGLIRVSMGKLDEIKSSEWKRAKKKLRWLMLLSITSLTLSLIPSLYIVGLTSKVYSLINLYVPNLGQKTKEVISYIVTILISGVLGNFAYDMLKRLVRYFKKSDYNSTK